MADALLYQTATPCEFCDNPAKYQCQNCDDALCTTCKEKHEKKKPHHKYVPYSQKARTVCAKHNAHKYIYWCESCRELCCTDCTITSHNGHDMVDIEDALRTKKIHLREHLDGPLKESLKNWKSLLKEARQLRKDYTKCIQGIDGDIVANAARVHTAVNENVLNMRKELRKIQNSTEMILQLQEHSINDKYDTFYEKINKLDDLQYGYDISLLEFSVEIADITALPTLTQFSSPCYSPGQINDQTIIPVVGNLSTVVQSLKGQTRKPADVTPSHKVEHFPQFLPIPTTLLSTQAVVSSFKARYHNPIIACSTSSGLAWVKTGTYCIQLLDRNGVLLDAINTDFEFNDVTVTPHGDILFTDWSNTRIVSASNDATSRRIKTSFFTNYGPCGICCLRNGDVIVTYVLNGVHRVIKYNERGDIVHEFDRNLFLWPARLAVNKVNGDVHICDTDKHKVLTFGTDHKLRYEFTGTDSKLFNPYDVSTDTSGRVLIADMENNRIQILDIDGKFIQYIHPRGLRKPCFIDVDSERNIWIGKFKGQVKILKYC